MPTSILNLIYREFLKSAAPGMASLGGRNNDRVSHWRFCVF